MRLLGKKKVTCRVNITDDVQHKLALVLAFKKNAAATSIHPTNGLDKKVILRTLKNIYRLTTYRIGMHMSDLCNHLMQGVCCLNTDCFLEDRMYSG